MGCFLEGLFTLRLYGGMWTEPGNNHWLFLSAVEGAPRSDAELPQCLPITPHVSIHRKLVKCTYLLSLAFIWWPRWLEVRKTTRHVIEKFLSYTFLGKDTAFPSKNMGFCYKHMKMEWGKHIIPAKKEPSISLCRARGDTTETTGSIFNSSSWMLIFPWRTERVSHSFTLYGTSVSL